MDTIITFTLAGGTVRGLLIDSTRTVREAQRLQARPQWLRRRSDAD